MPCSFGCSKPVRWLTVFDLGFRRHLLGVLIIISFPCVSAETVVGATNSRGVATAITHSMVVHLPEKILRARIEHGVLYFERISIPAAPTIPCSSSKVGQSSGGGLGDCSLVASSNLRTGAETPNAGTMVVRTPYHKRLGASLRVLLVIEKAGKSKYSELLNTASAKVRAGVMVMAEFSPALTYGVKSSLTDTSGHSDLYEVAAVKWMCGNAHAFGGDPSLLELVNGAGGQEPILPRKIVCNQPGGFRR